MSRRIEFERIALVHAEHLRRFAMRVSSDHFHAEDLTQDTLLSAWTNFHQFQLGTNCRAWLFKILVNLRNKRFRKCGTSAASLSGVEQTIDVAVPENISNSTEVRVAFERLSREHRDILRLGIVEGFSVRALAERLDIPPGTVMSRLSRARAKLRAALGRPDLAQALS